MALRDGNRIPGSVHDLAATLALSDVADQVLFVSPRTLRILGDLAEVDVKIYSRYAKSYLAGGMIDVVEDEDSEAEDVDEIANGFGLEVVPVGIYQPPWMSSAKRVATTQVIPTATPTIVDFDTLEDDIYSAFSLSTNGVIVPSDGYYQVVGRVAWAGASTGTRRLSIYLNGAEIVSTQKGSGTTGSLVQFISHSRKFQLNDNIELYCSQNTGLDLNLILFLSQMNNSLSVYRLG